MSFHEVNFDGLIGPTHHYAGLGRGNLASQTHAGHVSNPREAALQGLAKMRTMLSLGLKQAVLPPHPRPHLPWLKSIGKTIQTATDAELRIAFSASSMWTANAAWVSPSPDTADHRLHLTPANLESNRHRALEWPQTRAVLARVFPFAIVHEPASSPDEGAANAVRLCPSHGERGVEIFVFGTATDIAAKDLPKVHAPRQDREACLQVAERHQVSDPLLVRQNPAAIDAGVFHNDVIAVGNERTLLIHELAWANQPAVLAKLPEWVRVAEVPDGELPLSEAVRSYIFNSQLVTLPDGEQALVHPAEVGESSAGTDVVRRMLDDGVIQRAVQVNVRQSMHNGGGPACLRLRVAVDDASLSRIHHGVMLDDATIDRLEAWVKRHYRDRLTVANLRDPALPTETDDALAELETILSLPDLLRTPAM